MTNEYNESIKNDEGIIKTKLSESTRMDEAVNEIE